MPLLATQGLVPVSVGTYDAWTLDAGANKVVAVTPPDDDNTTAISALLASGSLQSYNMSDLDPPASLINSVTHSMRARSESNGQAGLKGFVRLGSSETFGTHRDTTDVWTSWNESLARPGGGGWLPEDVNAVQAGVKEDDVGGTEHVKVTTVELSISYEPVGGGFAFLLGQYLGPLIAVGLQEMPKLAREVYVRSRGRVLIERHGLERAWRELCAPRRIYLFS